MTNSDHAIETIRAAIALKRELAEAEAEAKRLKEQSKAAKQRLVSFSKSSRNKSREHVRRAQLVGEIFLDLAADNPPMWLDFRPALEASLASATNEDRALFSLPPLAEQQGSEEPHKVAETSVINTIGEYENAS